MTFHKAKEEYKWKQWKEQEEQILRKSGVSEEVIQRLRELDWQDFNAERRFWEHFSSNQEELYMFFASTFWRKMQNIFGECCISKLEKVAKP